MTRQKIDLRFAAALLAGAVAMAAIVVLLMRGGDGTDPEQPRPAPAPSADAGPVEDDDEDAGDPAPSGSPPPDIAVPRGAGQITCPAPTTTVQDAEGLRTALGTARPGDSIRLSPGVYQGRFIAARAGAADKPIFLCGDETAILDGGGVDGGYGLHLNGVAHWRLVGFTVRNSQKGVMADRTTASVISGLRVHAIGDEGVHLRNFSSGNTVQYSLIYNTGLRREKFGEGVYLGTAKSNWKRFSGGRMDRSDRNVVRGNVIRAAAEAIDVKEGTSGGRITGNVFDGSAMSDSKHTDSWVDVKGNGYLIEGNRGTTTRKDGFQTHEIVNGWGTGNVFRRNTIDLAGGDGVGIDDTAGGNTIECTNKVIGGSLLRKGNCA